MLKFSAWRAEFQHSARGNLGAQASRLRKAAKTLNEGVTAPGRHNLGKCPVEIMKQCIKHGALRRRDSRAPSKAEGFLIASIC